MFFFSGGCWPVLIAVAGLRDEVAGFAGTNPGALGLCRVADIVGTKMRATKAEQYRRHAAECLALSRTLTDFLNRTTLLNMAIAWTDLAEQAERNQRNDVVYEPPLRSTRPTQWPQQPSSGR